MEEDIYIQNGQSHLEFVIAYNVDGAVSLEFYPVVGWRLKSVRLDDGGYVDATRDNIIGFPVTTCSQVGGNIICYGVYDNKKGSVDVQLDRIVDSVEEFKTICESLIR